MLNTEYIRSLNANYERLLLERKPEEKKYQYCMISRGGIKGLLPCSLRYIDGEAYLYYDITSRQNIAQLLRRSLLQDNGSWTFCGVCAECGRKCPVSFWKRVTSCGFRNMSIRIWRRKNFIYICPVLHGKYRI